MAGNQYRHRHNQNQGKKIFLLNDIYLLTNRNFNKQYLNILLSISKHLMS